MAIPAEPKVYHITHVDNLPAMIAEGVLVSDAIMVARGGPATTIGMSSIKQRRLEELPVKCFPATKVGEYVPFYFCPRSVMLYIIYQGNHRDLAYRGGQDPIVHLELDLAAVVRWAGENERPWAFSLSNAGARYTEFCADLKELGRLNWDAIRSHDFRAEEVKESKQAEFLVHERVPFKLVERVGVRSRSTEIIAEAALQPLGHEAPNLFVAPAWYY